MGLDDAECDGEPQTGTLPCLLGSEKRVENAIDNFSWYSGSRIPDRHSYNPVPLTEHGEIEPAGFKELTGVTRKYLIPLAELFDERKVTLRIGNVRKLRR